VTLNESSFFPVFYVLGVATLPRRLIYIYISSIARPVLTQILSGGVRREGNRGAGEVTSRAGKEELQRAMSDVTRGEGGTTARPVDEGSARRRGIRGKTMVLRCEKDSATCGKSIALSV